MLMVDYREEKEEANWSFRGRCSCSCSGQKGCWFGLAGSASYEMIEFAFVPKKGKTEFADTGYKARGTDKAYRVG